MDVAANENTSVRPLGVQRKNRGRTGVFASTRAMPENVNQRVRQ